MSDRIDGEAGPPRKRGEAAWKAELEDTARRNAQASKRARETREGRERDLVARRRANEREQDAGLRSEFGFS
jgi:hypothetical protein